jgi:hypothetical protein
MMGCPDGRLMSGLEFQFNMAEASLCHLALYALRRSLATTSLPLTRFA